MRTVNIAIRCSITPDAHADREDLEQELDAVADAFFDIEDITDQDISYDLGTMTITFGMTFDAEDELDAVAKAHVFVRCAIHDAGGATPGWESLIKFLQHEEPRLLDA